MTFARSFRRVLIVVGFLVGLAVTWFCAYLGWFLAFGRGCHGLPRGQTTEIRVREVAGYVTDFARDEGRCPANIDELVEQRYVKRGLTDAWGNNFFVGCWGQRQGAPPMVVVRSAGPDHVFFTADDIESSSF
jgi:hypothetical protein